MALTARPAHAWPGEPYEISVGFLPDSQLVNASVGSEVVSRFKICEVGLSEAHDSQEEAISKACSQEGRRKEIGAPSSAQSL